MYLSKEEIATAHAAVAAISNPTVAAARDALAKAQNAPGFRVTPAGQLFGPSGQVIAEAPPPMKKKG